MIQNVPTYASIPIACLTTSLAMPLSADSLVCELKTQCEGRSGCDEIAKTLAFEIDRNQFASPVNSNEPPFKKVTTVQLGSKSFAAEPFFIDDTRGFWAESQDTIFVVEADGSASLEDGASGLALTGLCEDQE